MKDDLDLSFSPGDRFTGVRMQQGEVQQDADWNEGASLAARQVAREFDRVVDLAARADALVRSPALGSFLSDPAEQAFRVEPHTGSLRFGDGATGAVPGSGVAVEAGYRSGAGEAGGAATVPPFPIELTRSGDAGDPGSQILDAWATVADKLSAAQGAVAQEAHLPSAARGRGESDEDPIGGLTALLREVRSLAESFARRLERARSDSPPPGEDD